MNIIFRLVLTYCSTLVVLLLPVLTCVGQEFTEVSKKTGVPKTITALKVGDSLPDFVIPRLINYRGKPLRTGDFKDRLLLLDFWSVTCPGCVHALPKMYGLQQKFGEKIKILPVTEECIEKVSAFWKTNGYTKHLPLLSVVEDTVFSTYFTHRYLPHEVWVYQGKVIGITGADYVDARQIKRVLDGEKVSWPLKNDYYQFDFNTPLFTLDTSQIDPANTAIDYVAVSGHRSGVNSDGLSGGMGIKRNFQQKTVRVYMVNTAPYTALYLSMLSSGLTESGGKPDYLTPNRIEWMVSDRNRLEYRGKEISGYQQDWIQTNSICFESVHPDTGQTERMVHLQTILDLNKVLGLNVHLVQRMEKVFVLSQDSTKTNVQVLKHGIPSSGFVYQFNQRENNPYCIDQTGEEVLLPQGLYKIKDPAAIARAVRPFGLKLESKVRPVNKLVVAEKRPLLPNGALITEYRRRKALELPPVRTGEDTVFLKRNKTAAGVVSLPSGIQYKVIHKGTGRLIDTLGKVVLHYTGMTVNGKIFESTLENGLPQVLKFAEMLSGWKQVLPLMREGDQLMLYLPTEWGFGSHTGNGLVEPGSTLIYDIELLRVIP
jgi:thiol-disulfide isomerase/thioredoxin